LFAGAAADGSTERTPGSRGAASTGLGKRARADRPRGSAGFAAGPARRPHSPVSDGGRGSAGTIRHSSHRTGETMGGRWRWEDLGIRPLVFPVLGLGLGCALPAVARPAPIAVACLAAVLAAVAIAVPAGRGNHLA